MLSVVCLWLCVVCCVLFVRVHYLSSVVLFVVVCRFVFVGW